MKSEKLELIKQWDKDYYLHTFFGDKNYQQILVERTEGNYLYTYDGRKYLDFASQLVCVNLGNGNEKINESVIEAVNRYGFLWNKYLTEYRAAAAKKIIEDIPGVSQWAGRVKFFNSGSEAVEAAINLVRLLTGKNNILIKEYDFHGWTGEALRSTTIKYYGSLKSLPGNEISELPVCERYYTVPSPFCNRCKFGKVYPDCKNVGILYCVDQAERVINEVGPHTIAAFLAEPVSGFGMVFPPKEYFPQMREILDRYSILWVDDEVLTGFGRLGKWFAYDSYGGIYPDIMCIGKGMVNSLIPCSAMVVSKNLARILEDKIWYVGGTFSGHPVAMAAVAATIDYMLENNIVRKAEEKGLYMGRGLRELKTKHHSVGYLQGSGLFWQLEFSHNESNCRDLNVYGKYSPAMAVMEECFKNGLILGGLLPYTVRLSPSLTVTTEEIDWAVDILDRALTKIEQKENWA